MADIPFERIALFLRHHLHDVRNELNTLNLEATILGMIVTDAEALKSVERIQETLHKSAAKLSALSTKLSDPRPSRELVPVDFVLASWRDEARVFSGGPDVKWSDKSVPASVNLDVSHLAEAFRELISNASRYDGKNLEVTTDVEDGWLVLRLSEVKNDPVDPTEWGQAPFSLVKRDSQSLGLWRARRLVQVNEGRWSQQYQPGSKTLVSEMRFPIVAS